MDKGAVANTGCAKVTAAINAKEAMPTAAITTFRTACLLVIILSLLCLV
jgi:hypothetical protein